jgi:hypothetical protein
MSLGVFLIASASAINGWLSGLNMDTALVKLPARRRIGAVAYATFARGNDLGNGLVVYPLLGIGAVLLTVLATAVAYIERSPMEVLLLLSLASRFGPTAYLRYHQGCASHAQHQRRT